MENEGTPRKPRGKRVIGYGQVFLILAVITAVELGLKSLGLVKAMETTAFLLLSLTKASLVAAFFMHLWRDSRFYTYILIIPVALLTVFALLASVP